VFAPNTYMMPEVYTKYLVNLELEHEDDLQIFWTDVMICTQLSKYFNVLIGRISSLAEPDVS
jgi:hypothetical protein